MKRIFIAVRVDPEPELLKALSVLKTSLSAESIKWTDLANTHLTLAFLGDTEEKKIKILGKMLKDKCLDLRKFEFVLSGMGVFKNFRDPRVIWAGIRSSEKLSELNSRIAEGLRETGFSVEERPFRPHLTLGRIRSLKNIEILRDTLEKYRDTEFQSVKVNEVILFESILMQTGSLYKPLERFSLLSKK
jgi:RNA 2',3'-cyclic 3'-phosphodiesterase